MTTQSRRKLMSYLRWKKETETRKSLYIISSPWAFFSVLLFLVMCLLPVVAWLRSLAR